jgi:uncharacterized protein YceH (UPF0502 family)
VLLYGFLEELHEFSEANITAVSRELFQEPPYAPAETESSSSPRSNRQSPSIDPDLNQRLAELERAMSAIRKSLDAKMNHS